MSEMVKQILEVLKTSKHNIEEESINQEGISPDAAKKIINDSITEVANNFNVTSSTVADKCQRQLNLTHEQFLDMALDQILGNGNALQNVIIQNCKNVIGDDNPNNIPSQIAEALS